MKIEVLVLFLQIEKRRIFEICSGCPTISSQRGVLLSGTPGIIVVKNKIKMFTV